MNNKKVSDEETIHKIDQILGVQGVGIDEFEIAAQILRDTFPNGFDGKLAIEALEGVGDRDSQVFQAKILAMYGVPEMEDYFLQKFNEVKGDKDFATGDWTYEEYDFMHSMLNYLLYYENSFAQRMYEEFHKKMSSYPVRQEPFSRNHFFPAKDDAEKWLAFKATGKRWEPK
jgi:hypothetical protein